MVGLVDGMEYLVGVCMADIKYAGGLRDCRGYTKYLAPQRVFIQVNWINEVSGTRSLRLLC